jgi:hypothetical protein
MMTPNPNRSLKSVTAFVGSARKKGFTYAATRQFLDNLQSFGDVQGEIVFLSECDIGLCRGCKVCFERGEERCPLKGDRDVLIEKMMSSDGVVFASVHVVDAVEDAGSELGRAGRPCGAGRRRGGDDRGRDEQQRRKKGGKVLACSSH